jgi:hypothetical protein
MKKKEKKTLSMQYMYTHTQLSSQERTTRLGHLVVMNNLLVLEIVISSHLIVQGIAKLRTKSPLLHPPIFQDK